MTLCVNDTQIYNKYIFLSEQCFRVGIMQTNICSFIILYIIKLIFL